MMTSRDLMILTGAGILLLLALAAMAGLHEKHYRARSERIAAARAGGIETRLATLEAILAEDRFT